VETDATEARFARSGPAISTMPFRGAASTYTFGGRLSRAEPSRQPCRTTSGFSEADGGE